jgi:iron complex outermembrane receptor protein
MNKFTTISSLALTMALLAGAAHAETAAAAATAAATDASDQVTELIITGTRQTGLKAVDSPAPIEIVGAEALSHVGQPDLIQTLGQLVPSFNAQTFGGDTGNLTLSANLRGVSPNDTLVLVNGKRRHTTANLQVDPGAYQGGASVDLGLIPVGAIDHIEVLEDGAAAQYGTDAIAGVINIILKNGDHGGVLSGTGGSYYQGDGATGALSANAGFALGEKGFFNVTVEQRFHGFSQNGGRDNRITDINGALLPGEPASYASIPGFPNVNPVIGDSQQQVSNLFYNAGYDLGVAQFYSFGSYSHRQAQSRENYRPPSTVTDGAVLFAPLGFTPKEGLVENDYSFTAGFKGKTAGWSWDLSSTYGRDSDDISTLDSANASLFAETGQTPTTFFDGTLAASQWTNNLDINRDFNVGFASPLNVAFGVEERRDTYSITHGDFYSTYEGGGQSFEGWPSIVAGDHSRTNTAAYIDVATSPIEGLKVDAAGRFEHYSDFGDATVGKLTARYDFNPAFALRGTVSNGFRAPTLAEEYFSVTNVGPGFAIPQLPANSAAAKLLGFSNLKPEKSTNLSFGFVAHPIEKLTITADAYQIDIDQRVLATGTLLGESGTTVLSQPILNAIAASGLSLPPGGGYVGVSVFTNGADTQTRGLEFTASYPTTFDWGHIDWTAAANYAETTIKSLTPTPAVLGGVGALLNTQAISNLTTATPKIKVSLAALYTEGKWSVNLRETIYGPTSEFVSPDDTGNGPNNLQEKIGTTGITDLEVDYAATRQIKVALGANNLLNTRAPTTPVIPALGGIPDGGHIYSAPYSFAPWGINGGYYYGRVTYTF